MNIELETKINFLKGVGPKLALKLHRLGIETVADLIFHWPRRYQDYTQITKIGDLGISNIEFLISNQHSGSGSTTIRGRILGISNKLTSRQRMKITEAVVEDGTGTIKLAWFNQPFLQKMFREGSEWIFCGKVSFSSFSNELIMEAPTYVREPVIVPIYPETAGISSGYLGKLIKAQKAVIRQIDDFLSPSIIEKNDLLALSQAILGIHEPKDVEEISRSRRRLAFNELFLVSLRSRLANVELQKKKAISLSLGIDLLQKFIQSLPFSLTGDQKKAVDQILADMAGNTPMNRLLNGDVGSGKTVVAAIAAFVTARSGYQTALMVPTEVLAVQHYNSLCKLFSKEGVSVGLLTSSNKKVTGDSKLPQDADIIIGTQALLQKGVDFDRLSLVIVDEQHRFGVAQRAALTKSEIKSTKSERNSKIQNQNDKSKTSKASPLLLKVADAESSRKGFKVVSNETIEQSNNFSPHFLSMTATPIPRTLHLAFFGDLEVSIIKEKPQNRKEIKTRFVESFNRMKAYDFIRAQIRLGRQVFVICPLIEEPGEESKATKQELWDQDRKSVVKEYDRLSKEIFPEFKVAMLHGKMKAKEKETILVDFAARKFDILVSTSVIEVGIDVPNASVMMIEDAERFGLAQIHQFRGRVGRAEHQSFCFLFSATRGQKSLERLKSLEAVSDGFKLAEIDLETRGPGDIFGKMQSGDLELKLASFSDRIILEQASLAAKEIVEQDPELKTLPKLKARIEEMEMSRHLE